METIDLPPGVVNTKSTKRKSANWRETHLVRWQNGTLAPVGGWETVNYPPFASPLREMHRWMANDGKIYVAYLCEEHCYVDAEGVLSDITPIDGISPPPNVGEGGYGDDVYGTGDYGEPRDGFVRSVNYGPCYTLDNWGEELRAMTSSDGRLLAWLPSTPSTKLVAVANAPVTNRSFAITPERIIILFGAGGSPAKFQWCDQEDDTEWTVGTTTKAGEFDVEPRSPIIAHRKFSGGIIFFTARGFSYAIRYIGLPYVYAYDQVAECPPPYSAASLADIPQGILWAALNGLWVFNGVNVAPFPCPVWDWVKKYINVPNTKYQAYMMDISSKSEAWWFFSSQGSGANDKYVMVNYTDGTWAMGNLSRSCGYSFPNDANPVMSDGEKVYRHESGFSYAGAELPWAETFTMNVLNGYNSMTIRQMRPEVVGGANLIQFRFVKKGNPSNDNESMSPIKAIRSNGMVDVRETARDFRLRVEMVGAGDWTLGTVDIDAVGRGRK